MTELLKKRLHTAHPSNLSFWRDRSGHEVDLMLEQGGLVKAIEIKSGATVTGEALQGLSAWHEIAGDAAGDSFLVYGGTEAQSRKGITLLPWNDIRF